MYTSIIYVLNYIICLITCNTIYNDHLKILRIANFVMMNLLYYNVVTEEKVLDIPSNKYFNVHSIPKNVVIAL